MGSLLLVQAGCALVRVAGTMRRKHRLSMETVDYTSVDSRSRSPAWIPYWGACPATRVVTRNAGSWPMIERLPGGTLDT